jgi:hypothetical protein
MIMTTTTMMIALRNMNFKPKSTSFYRNGSRAPLLMRSYCTDSGAADLVMILSHFVHCTAVTVTCSFASGSACWTRLQVLELRATSFTFRNLNSGIYLPPNYSVRQQRPQTRRGRVIGSVLVQRRERLSATLFMWGSLCDVSSRTTSGFPRCRQHYMKSRYESDRPEQKLITKFCVTCGRGLNVGMTSLQPLVAPTRNCINLLKPSGNFTYDQV